MVVFKKRDSVPSARYSSVCNVLRQWRIWLIPTYRVVIYDILVVRMYVCSGPGVHVNAQRANVWPAGQGSKVTKITQKTAYLLPNSDWQNCSHSYGQRIEFKTRCPSGSVRTYKTPANRFLLNKNCYTL